jgi:holo-[acyl-carrier protein] synthase
MNVVGIGIDALEIVRFRKAVEERGEKFLEKVFTPREIEYVGAKKASYMHLAGKFAAKEAVKKALPDGAEIGLNWADIEILNGDDGKPYVLLHGHAKKLKEKFGISRVLISISHTKDLATSNAVVINDGA